MIIRKADNGDAHGIAKVHVKSWKETYKGIISQEYLEGLNVDDRLLLWENILSSPKDEAPVYVTVNNKGEIIGFASFGIERSAMQPTAGELYAVYLLEEYKRNGLGTMLLYEGLKDLMQQGFDSLLVWVLAENPSLQFYEHFVPKKEAVENAQIGSSFYEEIAYKWSNLNDLLLKIKNEIK